jgi:hypothetical protein
MLNTNVTTRNHEETFCRIRMCIEGPVNENVVRYYTTNTEAHTHTLDESDQYKINNGVKAAVVEELKKGHTSKTVLFTLSRKQFPVRVCFAMTINKSQGQSFNTVGVDLRTPVFSHGQFYVAMSRVSDPSGLHVLLPESSLETTNKIVWPEILGGLNHGRSRCFLRVLTGIRRTPLLARGYFTGSVVVRHVPQITASASERRIGPHAGV